MRTKHSMKSLMSGLLAAVTMLVSFPSIPAVYAAQINAYIDPADVWLATNNRTSELDANAVVTYGTANCEVCGHVTPQTCYRVPEYTRSGETALNRNVLYSDGTCMDGVSKANLDDGTPGIDAFYSGYHWTKSVCNVCGTLNVVDGEGSYSFGKDVYSLNACDYNFFLDFDNTTYTPYDKDNHTTTLKKGKYCQFCHGTYARAEDKQEAHNITEIVDAQLGNQRFHITGECDDCGFIENEYAVAKSVVQSYYGIADGSAHTITLSDLSESGVNTSIRYGESADKCNLTSAPNYTEAGYYPVYYEITYRYAGESMKENGVSYVWLLADNSSSKLQSDASTPHVHDYRYLETVRPTCTELGYTTITCSVCGETHKINYVEAAGHKPSEWIIDTPATIEHSGSKHKQCTVCGETLETAEIPQLSDKDNSDEDGKSTVGDYSILITDKNNKPIFNSEISIDTADNITIKLPDGRLLSADDITTITVTNSETQQPAEGISIFAADASNNAATGKTDANGQLKVPNANSSTGDSNGTVADQDNTYVVVVTDNNGELIPNCDVTVGNNYSINVKLPDGTPFDKDNRVTVTVVTEKGEPVSGLRVQLIGDGDFVENGYTNIRGQITLPVSNTDITDNNGNGEVGDKDGEKVYDYIVTVSNENGLIKDALITLIAKDTSVLVCLPQGKVIDYYNRITVKVMRSDGTPVKDWKVSVYNKDGSGLRTELTDEDGIVVVPPLSEAPLSKPTPIPDPGAEATPLPGVETTPKPDVTEKPSETEKPSNPTETPAPSDKPTQKPTETTKPTDTPKPGETTKPTETPSEPTPTPDMGDGAVVQNKNYKYRVFVWDNDGAITEFGLVKLRDDGNLEIELPENKTLNPENKVNIRVINENGNMYNVNAATETKGNIEGAEVKIADGKITVTLPDGTVIDYADRTTVTVTDKDNAPVKDMSVNVKDTKGGDRTGATDADGKVIVPPLSEDMTDKDGNAVVDGYTVVVEDTKAKIENVFVEIKDGKISVKLPDTNTFTTSNQTTVTVTDKDTKPVKGMSVTITDKNNATAADVTNASGKVTLPKKSSSGGGGGSSSGGGSHGGGGGGSVTVTTTYNVKVTDKDGKTVNVAKSVKDSKITLTLPNGKTLDGDDYYTIVVTDKNGKAAPDIDVTLKDKKNNTANGVTDANGKLVLPATEHKSYIVGYEDGSFMPEGNMTRAEAAAIFARNIAERKNEKMTGVKSKFTDIAANLWYSEYIAYLENYNIIVGYDDGTFRPDEQITRAEFVTMCMRFYEMFDKAKSSSRNIFSDVPKSHWASANIYNAIAMDWIKGYADGTFKPDNNITRAEVVTIVNRVTDREADTEYVNKNLSTLNRFTDLTDKGYWAYYEITEAANTHMAIDKANGETWVK